MEFKELPKRKRFDAVMRTKELIVLFVVLYLIRLFLPTDTTERLIAYKLMIAVAASVVGHWVVTWLTPYIRLGHLLFELGEPEHERSNALRFLGAAIMRGLIMGAIITGCLLGI